MPLEIKSCVPSDFPNIVSVENRAYADNPFSPIMFPGPFPENSAETRAQELAKQIEDEPAGRWLKVVDTDSAEPDKAISVAKWQMFRDKLPGPRQNRAFGDGCNVELCNELFGMLGKAREKYIGDKHCVYLQVAATDPDHQGRGAAGMLVRWGIEKADEYGLPAYLESNERAHGLYQKYGFKDLECCELDFNKYGHNLIHRAWPMMYTPSA